MKTITIPLELAESLLSTFHNDNCWDEALHGQLESLIKAQRLIDSLSLAQQALNDAPVSVDSRKLFDLKAGEIVPPQKSLHSLFYPYNGDSNA